MNGRHTPSPASSKSPGNKSPGQCHNCGKPGHWKSDARSRKSLRHHAPHATSSATGGETAQRARLPQSPVGPPAHRGLKLKGNNTQSGSQNPHFHHGDKSQGALDVTVGPYTLFAMGPADSVLFSGALPQIVGVEGHPASQLSPS